MSAFLRAKLKRKQHPVEYVDPPCGEVNPNPNVCVLTGTSSDTNPSASSPIMEYPSTSNVAMGFNLMNNYLNYSLSAGTKTEYQVCKFD